jgi:hypothetical protein
MSIDEHNEDSDDLGDWISCRRKAVIDFFDDSILYESEDSVIMEQHQQEGHISISFHSVSRNETIHNISSANNDISLQRSMIYYEKYTITEKIFQSILLRFHQSFENFLPIFETIMTSMMNYTINISNQNNVTQHRNSHHQHARRSEAEIIRLVVNNIPYKTSKLLGFGKFGHVLQLEECHDDSGIRFQEEKVPYQRYYALKVSKHTHITVWEAMILTLVRNSFHYDVI